MKPGKNRMVFNKLIGIILVLFITSCSAAQPTTANKVDLKVPSTTNPSTSYPYPAVSEKTIILRETLTPDPQTGRVEGFLYFKGKPKVSTELALAHVVTDTSGQEIATAFDRANSPMTNTSDNGYFLFENVKPGRYGLIYADLPETYLLLKPGDSATQEAVLLTVEAGSVFDLGKLDYDQLPGE
jgi:hypothetical protein